MDLFKNYFQSVMEESNPVYSPKDMAQILAARVMLNYPEYRERTLSFLARKFASMSIWPEAYKAAKCLKSSESQSQVAGLIQGVEHPVPKGLNTTIEVISACNLKCPLCSHGEQEIMRAYGALNKVMPFEAFKTIWDKVKDKTSLAILVGMGESFLHKNIYDILDYIAPTAVLIDTNGAIPMDHEKIVRSSISKLVFSVDGIDQRTYEKYRVGGNFEKVIENIKATVAAKKRFGKGPMIVFKYIVFKHNEMYVEEAEKLAKSLGVDHFQTNPCNIGLLPRDQVRRFIPCGRNAITRVDFLDYGQGWTVPVNDIDSPYCLTPFSSPYVQINGNLLPCCAARVEGAFGDGRPESEQPKTVFGNLLESGFDELWQGEKMRDFRLRALSNRYDMPECAACLMPQNHLGHLFDGTVLEAPKRGEPSGDILRFQDIKIEPEYLEYLGKEGLWNEIQYYTDSGALPPAHA